MFSGIMPALPQKRLPWSFVRSVPAAAACANRHPSVCIPDPDPDPDPGMAASGISDSIR